MILPFNLVSKVHQIMGSVRMYVCSYNWRGQKKKKKQEKIKGDVGFLVFVFNFVEK